jgi:hypothetical protein
MKFILVLILILSISVCGIFTLTPAKYQIPNMFQVLMNLRDPNADHDGNLDEIEAMQQKPLLCYQNNDCTIQKCGQAPNCNSMVVNKQYLKKNSQDYTCPAPEYLEICDPEYQLYVYTACEDNECTLKTLSPSPTPLETLP